MTYSKHRSSYEVFYKPGFVCVVDLDRDISVTNDIENVIADLAADLDPSTRLIYRDSTGNWDAVVLEHVDDWPYFGGFISLNQTSMDAAITKALELDVREP